MMMGWNCARGATLPCPDGARDAAGCGGDAVCPGGAKALLCGAPDFGGLRGKACCGAVCLSGRAGRRAGRTGGGGAQSARDGYTRPTPSTPSYGRKRALSPLRRPRRRPSSTPPATAIFPRHPAGRTAGSARTRPRDQDRLSSKCNSLEEDIERRAPVESLARPVVDQIKDALKLRLRYVQKVTTPGKEISKQSIGVFVAAPLPRLMRFRKIHWRFELLLQFSKLRKF